MWMAIYLCTFYESEVINVKEDSVLLLCSFKGECQNISLYEPEQSLSLSQDEGEGVEVYPKQSSFERSF